MSQVDVFDVNGELSQWPKWRRPLRRSYVAVYKPTGLRTERTAFFESDRAFTACLARWNNEHPGVWAFEARRV